MKFRNLLPILLTLGPVHALAAPPVTVSLKGKPIFAPVESDEITLVADTIGNSSSAFELSVSEIEGIQVRAEQGMYQPGPGGKEVVKVFSPIELLDYKARKARNDICTPFAPGESGEDEVEEVIPDPNLYAEVDPALCDDLLAGHLTELTEEFKKLWSEDWTEGKVCAYVLALTESAPKFPTAAAVAKPSLRTLGEESGGGTFTGLISKNACAPRNSKYMVRVSISLKKVKAENKPKKLYVRLKENKYSGTMASTIKPESEGRFAPQPLLLMSKLPGYCGQQYSLAMWAGAKLVRRSVFRIEDFLMYRDLMLGRSPIGSMLSGGKGSFEISDTENAYSVCFSLERKRQRVNGYPS